MTLNQRLLENSAGTTTAITAANKALIDAVTVSLNGGTQNFTPTGHEITVSAASTTNVTRWAATATSDQMSWDWLGSYSGAGTSNAFTATGVLYQGMSSTSASAGAYPWKGRFPASGNMVWQDFAGATITLTSGAHAPLPNTDYRYSIVGDRAAGTITIKAYSTSGTLLATWSKTGANLGTDPFYGIEADAPNNQVGTTRIHRLQMDDGRTTEIGAYAAQTPALVPVVTLSPTTGPVPRTDGTNGTSVLASITTTGGNSNAKTYAVLIQYSANGNFTDTTTYLDTTGTYTSSASFTFTPGAVGSYRVTPYVQQAA